MAPAPAPATPGRLLASRRRQLGLTQRQIADHVGITAQAVSEWERGTAQPARRYALAADELLQAGGEIAEAFGYVIRSEGESLAGELRAAVAKLGAEVEELGRRVSALEHGHARSGRSRPRAEPPPRQRARRESSSDTS